MRKARTLPLDPMKTFKLFHITFALVILVASLKTVIDAMGTSNLPLIALASVEAIAAIFFAVSRFTYTAGMVLMAIFLLVIMISVLTGSIIINVHLILYFVCTLFIVVHKHSRRLAG